MSFRKHIYFKSFGFPLLLKPYWFYDSLDFLCEDAYSPLHILTIVAVIFGLFCFFSVRKCILQIKLKSFSIFVIVFVFSAKEVYLLSYASTIIAVIFGLFCFFSVRTRMLIRDEQKKMKQAKIGGLKWTRTTDLTLIRRAL